MHHWKAALRSAVRRPLFTLTTVTVLAFGVGANAALFSLVDTVLLRPLPFPHGDRLVTAMEASPSRNQPLSLVSPATFRIGAHRVRFSMPCRPPRLIVQRI